MAALVVASTVIIGKGAGAGVMTADANGTVAIGALAGAALTTGAQNTAIGYGSLDAQVTGDNNTAVGYNALTANNTANNRGNNTAIGHTAGAALTTGSSNTILGSGAGVAAQDVDSTVIIGRGAGVGVMTAAADGTVAIGRSAGAALTTGEKNVAIGFQALQDDIRGDSCVAIGYQALLAQNGTSGEAGNVAIGSLAGDVITSGTNNTIIGSGSDPSANSGTNQSVIGYAVTGVANNSVTLGNASVTAVYMAQDSGATVHCGGVFAPYPTETVVASTDPDPIAAESGKVFIVPAIAATTITLPAVAVGLNFRILFSHSPSGAITLDCDGGAIFQGVVIGTADAASPAIITNRNTVIFGASTAIGDSADILCDGVNWHVRAYVAAHGTVSFS